MDALFDLLNTIRLKAGDGYQALLSPPWAIDFPERPSSAPFYVVDRGVAVFEAAGRQVLLSAGDMVTLPHGQAHRLGDSLSTPAVPFRGLPLVRTDGCPKIVMGRSGDEETRIMAGVFVFDEGQVGTWFRKLPDVIHLRSDEPGIHQNIEPLLKMLLNERRAAEPGSQFAETELVKLLFLNILRYTIRRENHQGNCPRSPLALMFDPQLRRLTESLHDHPGRPWTVTDMAKLVGMSRSKFMERFTQVAGESPGRYLVWLRMTKAVSLLAGSATLQEIAREIGYGSEVAFSAAFKREVGQAPGGYRRNRQGGEVLSLQ